jgi:hypothetical protein
VTFPAFKEWHVIVEALGAGEQILILRKGGIAESCGGFRVEASRFWLFPTRFHAQREKTKPAAHRWFEPEPAIEPSSSSVTLRYFADVVQTAFLDNWDAVLRLDPHHFWTEETLRERFDWSRPPGLHAIAVRTHKLLMPLILPVDSAMSGCKSWIDLPCAFDARGSAPVLDDRAFADRLAALSL